MKLKSGWFDKNNFRGLLIFLISFILIYLDSSHQKYFKEIKKGVNDIVIFSSYIITFPFKKIIEIPGEVKILINLKDEKNQITILENKVKELTEQNYFLKQNFKKIEQFLKEEEPYRSQVVHAKVIYSSESIFSDSFIINRGSEDGIKEGNPVIKNNNLIGQVSEVNYNSSRVMLLTDINSRIPVVVGDKMYHAILVGNHLKPGKLTLEFLPKESQLQNNDKIFTSDIDGVLKQGISVGYIEKKTDLKNDYIIRLNNQINTLSHVSIFIN